MSEEEKKLDGPDFAQGVALADIAEGGMILGHVAGDAVLLARRGQELFAIGAACTHYHGPLVEEQKAEPWLWSHWADRDARRSGQSRGVPRFRRERLRHRHRTLRRWRCCADLRNAVSVALAAVTRQSGEATHEQPKNPLWPLV